MSPKKRVAILANVPVWTLPGLSHLHHSRHYATWLEPLIPAFERYTEELELHWITLCKEADTAFEHHAFGQTFHIIPRWKLSASMLTGYLYEISRIRKVLKRIQPDLLHAWGSEDVCGLAGACSGIDKRIFTLQGSLTEYVRILGGPPLFRLQSFYERPTVSSYAVGTAESPGAAHLLQQLNSDMKVTIIDYGVNPEFFNVDWVPSESPEVVFVGGITQRKGVNELMKIASMSELAHIKFRFVGEGPLRAICEAKNLPNVEFVGNCQRSEVIKYLSSAWVLAMPTMADTGPTVIKEARVIGLPVITTSSAGASSYISGSGCGIVTRVGDSDALAASILQVCASRTSCLQFGKAGWPEHRILLHPDTTAAKFVLLYNNI
jgi:glycosyltransferase involved in cell wall biosynthesis